MKLFKKNFDQSQKKLLNKSVEKFLVDHLTSLKYHSQSRLWYLKQPLRLQSMQVTKILLFRNKVFIFGNKKACLFPLYMNRAAIETNPLERFKLVLTTTISSFYFTNTFLKPVISLFIDSQFQKQIHLVFFYFINYLWKDIFKQTNLISS